ncbi:Decarbamoylnovobiocin carbamoyltransferase [Prochlorococcus marinus str. MIT 1342]|nr:Decarbamoylnovobiocin carbamoyltransferase [Prochlorococcus marinus str. MIT 1342]
MDNRKLIGNIEFERITRKKNDGSFGEKLLIEALDRFKVGINDIAAIASGYCGNPYSEYKSPELGQWINFESKINFSGNTIPLLKVHHHYSHALCALAASSPEAKRILVMTADGWGDDTNFSGWYFDKESNRAKPLVTDYNNRAPACMWHVICNKNYGFESQKGPGKLMALAAYGEKSQKIYNQLIAYATFGATKEGAIEEFNLGEDLRNKEAKRSQDIAHNLQQYTNDWMHGKIDYILHLAKKLNLEFDEFGISGGLALNIVATSAACRMHGLNKVVIPPFPDDSGLAFGHCIAAVHSMGRRYEELSNSFTPYMGPKYTEDFILKVLQENVANIIYDKIDSSDEYCERFSSDLQKRFVCFRYHENSESGPRALGARSILYDPSDPQGRDMINKIKNREWYRPFAPMILEEYMEEVLKDPLYSSHYMTTSSHITNEYKTKFISAMHVNSTCRPQSVSKERTPLLYNTIKTFYDKTKIPGLLNTSFNINGPIVETPKEAMEIFLSSKTKKKVLYVNFFRVECSS